MWLSKSPKKKLDSPFNSPGFLTHWSWIHTKMLTFFHFSMLSRKLQCFHSDSRPPIRDKMLMQSIFRWPVESCVMNLKCSWSWTFQLIEQHSDGIVFWYRSIGQTLITPKKEIHMWESDEKMLCVRWIQLQADQLRFIKDRRCFRRNE